VSESGFWRVGQSSKPLRSSGGDFIILNIVPMRSAARQVVRPWYEKQ